MDSFLVDVHHCGQFVDPQMTKYEGDVANWECDADKWSYFEILGICKEMGYLEVVSMFYEAYGVKKQLVDDVGAMEMINLSKSNGKVDLYLIHPVQEANCVPLIELVPEVQNVEAQNDVETENEPQNNVEAECDEDDLGYNSDDSAIAVRFGTKKKPDSDDEIEVDDGFEQIPIVGGGGDGNNTQNNKTSSKKRKRSSSGKKRGRPQKQVVEETFDDGVEIGEESDEDDLNLGKTILIKERRRDRGLSDEEYVSEEIETEESEVSGDEEVEKVKHPSFVMPRRMDNYKWILGTLFSTKDQFKYAIMTYAVHNCRDLRWKKNNCERVNVVCKEGCEWLANCVKLPNEDTCQLRKLVDSHSCSIEYRVKMLNSAWLGKKLLKTVRENPKIKLDDICNKAHEKWNAGICKMKASRARRAAIDLVDGSFKEQYTRLYDYAHELLRSNPNSTLKINVQATEQQ